MRTWLHCRWTNPVGLIILARFLVVGTYITESSVRNQQRAHARNQEDAAKALGQPGLINNDSLLPSTSDKGSMSSAAEEETTHGCSGHSSDVTDRSDDPKKRRHEDTNTRAAPPEHTKT
eukprot:TRINITY_DN4310_c0_g1_i4.p2 TRINITY_DN4310_c0_g1~~TRINITY_DN4310_c0_g1_i4.p2  ORF type:complete len:119 (-),score=16.86 TRINITY_DN4310_c0_g1_i4:1068-1424(-)